MKQQEVVSAIPAELSKRREAFYAEISEFHLGPLWAVLSDAMTTEPKVKSVPYLWRWKDVRPRMFRSAELITAEEAERRVLMLLNPALKTNSATATLYAGVQLIMPGEVARTHHHTPNAIRFVIEGEGAFTTVNGERSLMKRGDFLTTPIWAWHDHGNESGKPMLWLDGLDMPFVLAVDAMFFEYHPELTQPLRRSAEDSLKRYGSNLLPTFEQPIGDGRYSPVLNYRWETSRAALAALKGDPASPFDGVIMEYTNPYTGGPSLPTMSSYLQLLRKGEHTQAHRHTSSVVYHVAEGSGVSIVQGQELRWEEGDTFVVPTWSWHEHAAEGGEAVLFSYSDRPIMRSFGFEREEAHPDGRQK